MRGCGSRSSFLSFIHCCPEFPCPAKPPSPRFLSYVQLGHLRFLGMIRKCHERRAPWKGSLGVCACGPCAPAFAPSGSPSPGVWSGLTDLILAHRKQRKGGPSLPRSGYEETVAPTLGALPHSLLSPWSRRKPAATWRGRPPPTPWASWEAELHTSVSAEPAGEAAALENGTAGPSRETASRRHPAKPHPDSRPKDL